MILYQCGRMLFGSPISKGSGKAQDQILRCRYSKAMRVAGSFWPSRYVLWTQPILPRVDCPSSSQRAMYQSQVVEHRALGAVKVEHVLLGAAVEAREVIEDQRPAVDLDRIRAWPVARRCVRFQVATLYSGSRTIAMSSKNARARSTQR